VRKWEETYTFCTDLTEGSPLLIRCILFQCTTKSLHSEMTRTSVHRVTFGPSVDIECAAIAVLNKPKNDSSNIDEYLQRAQSSHNEWRTIADTLCYLIVLAGRNGHIPYFRSTTQQQHRGRDRPFVRNTQT
jgi:hypothetical protein